MVQLASQPKPSKLDRYRQSFYLVGTIIGCVIIFIGIGYALGKISTALSIVALSLLAVFIMRQPVGFFERKGIPRAWGTLITFVIATALFVCIIIIIEPLFGDQISALIAAVPGYSNQIVEWGMNLWTKYGYLFADSTVQGWLKDFGSSLTSWASSLASASASGVISLGTSIGNALLILLMSAIASFWFLKDLPRMGKEVRILVGPRYLEDFQNVTGICSRVAGGYIKGVLIASLCTGTIAGIGYAIAGLPYPAVLGLITGLLNVIPYVGPWIGGAIAAFMGLFVSPLLCLVAIIITVAAQQLTDAFITPRVMSSTVELHPALVIIALMAGGSVGGIVGMIAAVPVFAAAKAIFVYFFEKKTKRRIVFKDGALFAGDAPDEEDDVVDPAKDATISTTPEPQPVKVVLPKGIGMRIGNRESSHIDKPASSKNKKSNVEKKSKQKNSDNSLPNIGESKEELQSSSKESGSTD